MQFSSRTRFLLLSLCGGMLCAQETMRRTASQYSGPIQLHNQAVNLERLGRFADAETQFREALHAWEALPAPQPVESAFTLGDLGNLLRVQGRYLEAERLLRRAVSIEERDGGPVQPHLAESLNSLGALYCNLYQPTRAIPLLQRGLAIREQILGAEHPLVASSLSNLADAFLLIHRIEDAEALYRHALKILNSTAEHPTLVALTNCKLAQMYCQGRRAGTRNLSEAETLYQRSLAAWDHAPERDHPQMGLALSGLAELYFAQRRYQEAEPLLKRALEIQERALGPSHPQVARILLVYASLLRKQHRRREATKMEKQAKYALNTSSERRSNAGTVDVNTLKMER